jgi:fibronectin type 3 domain-containing protein
MSDEETRKLTPQEEKKKEKWERKEAERKRRNTTIIVVVVVVVIVVIVIIWWACWSRKGRRSEVPAPTGLTATTSNSTITLNWNAVPGATDYNVYVSNSAGCKHDRFNAKVRVQTNTATLNLPPGTYYFAVSAIKICGQQESESALSNEVSATTPTCPGSNLAVPDVLDAESLGGGQVELEWPGVLDASSYNVYRAQGRPVTTSDYDQVFNSDSTEVLFTGLASGTSQSFIVTSVDACGNETGPSPQVTVTVDCASPPLPEITNVTPTTTSINVQWSALDGVTGYVVYLNTGSSVGPSNYAVRTVVASSIQSFTFNSLTPSTAYVVGVSATNACGEGSLNVAATNTLGLTTTTQPQQAQPTGKAKVVKGGNVAKTKHTAASRGGAARGGAGGSGARAVLPQTARATA